MNSTSASAATITIETDPDSHATEHIDLSPLQCYVVRTRTRTWMPATRDKSIVPEPQLITKQVRCETRVVYRVFVPNGKVLDMCNQHFNEYFERHNIGADMVMRLSDDEEDFVPAARRMKKGERGRSGNGNGNGHAHALHAKPICQVPRPR